MLRGPEFTEEILDTFSKVDYLLTGMINDRGVPRNIKRVAQKGIQTYPKMQIFHFIRELLFIG